MMRYNGFAVRALSAFAVAVLTVSAYASGVQEWWNGDFDNRNGLASERNTLVSDARVYEDFLARGTALVNGMRGQFYISGLPLNGPIYWEIRVGAAPGTGGTLIASGTASSSTWVQVGSGFGLPIYDIRIKIPTVTLAGNQRYWITMAPEGTGSGRAFVATTSGASNINGFLSNPDNALFDSTYFGYVWTPANQLIGSPADFALGVQLVPEPASMIALGTGLAGLLALRRRKK